MASQMSIISRTRSLHKSLSLSLSLKSISTFPSLSQSPELAESQSESQSQSQSQSLSPSPLPPNPSSGSPLYAENWRNPNPPSTSHSIIPLGFLNLVPGHRIQTMAQTFNSSSLMDQFADWMASQEWAAIKELFESWVKCLDRNSGKPNKPDVGLYNIYLRANLMIGCSAAEMLDFLAAMEGFELMPNTASFNLVLKAMFHAKETEAAMKLLERLDDD